MPHAKAARAAATAASFTRKGSTPKEAESSGAVMVLLFNMFQRQVWASMGKHRSLGSFRYDSRARFKRKTSIRQAVCAEIAKEAVKPETAKAEAA